VSIETILSMRSRSSATSVPNHGRSRLAGHVSVSVSPHVNDDDCDYADV
jgi:hypothetical protein